MIKMINTFHFFSWKKFKNVIINVKCKIKFFFLWLLKRGDSAEFEYEALLYFFCFYFLIEYIV
jgi:hypothetical protein